MTPSAIIGGATADGVMLSLSPSGTIKATGDVGMVNQWLPAIREHKPAIIKALLEADACTGDVEAIRAWLAYIGETDPAIIADVLGKCEHDADARDYFIRRAGEVPQGVPGQIQNGDDNANN